MSAYAPSDVCPECKMARLVYEYGSADPLESDELYCPDCGVDFEVDVPRLRNRELAVEIADDLFINGGGQRAMRLVMELESGGEGGGWCHSAVVDRIAERLDARGSDQ